MKVRKAVITAAGKAQRSLPLQRFVDRDGTEKTLLAIILEEVLAASVEEIAVIISPGDAPAYKDAAAAYASRCSFIEQHNPRGYGDAILRAAPFLKNEPFVHLVSDHLYISKTNLRCAAQLVKIASDSNCAVSAVQATRESMLPYYGVLGAHRVPQQQKLYEVESVIEKPTPTQAEQSLTVPGLRAGHYLCFFGMHVLTPSVIEVLQSQLASADPAATITLSAALNEIAKKEKYLALEIEGARHNIGVKYGILSAQLALAMSGQDREEVLAQLVELLATTTATR